MHIKRGGQSRLAARIFGSDLINRASTQPIAPLEPLLYPSLTDMLRLATALAVLLAIAAPSALAFSPAIRTVRKTTALKYHPTSFDRAVDCVSTFGKCDIDELLELSEGKRRTKGKYLIGKIEQLTLINLL